MKAIKTILWALGFLCAFYVLTYIGLSILFMGIKI